MSLQKSVWGNKAFGGYAGLKFTASIIKEYIPKSKIYVEPFAGLGRTVESKHDKVILNDKSDYAVSYLKSHFPFAEVTQEDFEECIVKHDSEDTFYLIDPPYANNVYALNEKCFIDRDYRDYYKQLANILPKLQGSWIVCINERNYHRFVKSLFPTSNSLNIKSKKNSLFGLKANVRIISNKQLISNQITLLTDSEGKN